MTSLLRKLFRFVGALAVPALLGRVLGRKYARLFAVFGAAAALWSLLREWRK